MLCPPRGGLVDTPPRDRQGKQNTVCSSQLLEFKQTTDQREKYEERARARTERQYEDLVQSLLRVRSKPEQGWTAKPITFVGGTCGSVNVTSFEENLKELHVLESK